jgi:hypothetical protein
MQRLGHFCDAKAKSGMTHPIEHVRAITYEAVTAIRVQTKLVIGSLAEELATRLRIA